MGRSNPCTDPHPAIMAPTQEPLLGSPCETTRKPCRVLCATLCLAAFIGLTALVSLRFTTTTDLLSLAVQPSDLCARSPNPSACHAIVSDALVSAAASTLRPSRVHVLRAILRKSLLRLEAAAASTADVSRRINDAKERLALADCGELLDLSRDRLSAAAAAAASGAHADARTCLSAVLTNHDTCLDGLEGRALAGMRAGVESLMALASASLAVLGDDYVGDERVAKFPSWVSRRDRKLLESAVAPAEADAIVAQDGSEMFKTVQEAVDSAPDGGKARYVIYVKKGVYNETVRVGKKKTNVMIFGDGMDATVITGSLNVVDGTTTFNSPTFAAVGDGLILQDLKIENTAGAAKHQAVALRVGADRAVINRCRLEAYQDTLYAHSLRQFYRDCTVAGTVDFIFGNAAVVFQSCTLVARRPMDQQQNLVTAQGRIDPNQNTGTSVQDCQVVAGDDLAPVKAAFPTYLGRPWKEYSRVVFMQSYLGDHVDPKGWLEWDGDFALTTLFYGEYMNRGPGAGTGGRVNWPGYQVITDTAVAEAFTVAALIQGGSWLQSTGVTFTEGL